MNKIQTDARQLPDPPAEIHVPYDPKAWLKNKNQLSAFKRALLGCNGVSVKRFKKMRRKMDDEEWEVAIDFLLDRGASFITRGRSKILTRQVLLPTDMWSKVRLMASRKPPLSIESVLDEIHRRNEQLRSGERIPFSRHERSYKGHRGVDNRHTPMTVRLLYFFANMIRDEAMAQCS